MTGQRAELHDPPRRPSRHQRAQAPHHPIRTGVEELPHLIGARRMARRAVGCEVGLERLDMVFRLARQSSRGWRRTAGTRYRRRPAAPDPFGIQLSDGKTFVTDGSMTRLTLRSPSRLRCPPMCWLVLDFVW